MADNGAIGTADCDWTIGDAVAVLPKTVVAELPLAAVAGSFLPGKEAGGVASPLTGLTTTPGEYAHVVETGDAAGELAGAVAVIAVAAIGIAGPPVTGSAAAMPGADAGIAMTDALSAAWLGSNTKIPPAPTTRLVPSGKALALAMTRVPWLTVVTPL